jgi:hypothetical protein
LGLLKSTFCFFEVMIPTVDGCVVMTMMFVVMTMVFMVTMIGA